MTTRNQVISADNERAVIERALTIRGATASEAQAVATCC